MTLFKRKGSEFNQMLPEMSFNWCQIMTGGKRQAGFVGIFMKMLKNCCSSAFRQCPYNGMVELLNITVNKDFFMLSPRGTFRADTKIQVASKTVKADVYIFVVVTVV